MAFSVVQHTSGSNSTTSLAVAYASNVTAGNLLVCFVRNNQTGQTNTCSDNLNGSWTSAVSDTSNSSVNIFYFPNTLGGACTVTATLPSSAQSHLLIAEISGAATSSPVDVSGKSTGTSASPSTSITTTNVDFVFGGALINGGFGGFGGGAFTSLDSAGTLSFDEYQIQTSSGAISVTFTVSSGSPQWQVLAVGFLPPPVVAPTGGGTVYSLDYDTRPNDIYYIIT